MCQEAYCRGVSLEEVDEALGRQNEEELDNYLTERQLKVKLFNYNQELFPNYT